MIKSVTVINHLGEETKIVLEDEYPKHGFLLESISGLGPAKATINTTDLATGDGSKYNSARMEKRNIVISLIFTQADSIEETRQRSYRVFPSKRNVDLIIETDRRVLKTTGYVETNEPDIFSDKEGTQISILCPDPYFYKYGKDAVQRTILAGVEALFEFPFSNESLSKKLIEFGDIKDLRETSIIYEGDHEVGLTIKIHAIGSVSNITLYSATTREIMTINNDVLREMTGSGIVAGDDIIISTVRGNRSILLLRNAVYTNILNCVKKGTDWITLLPGKNILAFSADEGSEKLYITIENNTLYEGV